MAARIGVIGAGAWGTALAAVAARAGCETALWARNAGLAEDIRRTRVNSVYLPDVALDPAIVVTAEPRRALDADAVLLAVPAQRLRAICQTMAPLWRSGVPAVLCAKGIEISSGALMSDVASEELPAVPIVCLSGPSFAIEAARGQPTAVTLACEDETVAERLARALKSPTFRPYVSPDLTGAEIGGAAKNVLAIACGILFGRGFGDNARAALLTRGLAEIARLGVACGGRPETFMGLSGLGDLVLTASSLQSRNYSLGVALGEGRPLAEVLSVCAGVAEGVATAGALMALAARKGVETPICAGVNALLSGARTLDAVIDGLLARPIRFEPEHSTF